MAKVKLVCGECGAELSATDKNCPQCGAILQSGEALDQRVVVKCPQCGHENANAGDFCESCGARVQKAAGGSSDPQKKRVDVRTSKKQPSRKPAGQSSGKLIAGKFEPWQIVSFVAVAILIAFFVYGELTRDRASTSATTGAMPTTQMPSMESAVDPGPEIQKLQREVDANPNDGAALLRLSNMLHDAAQHDPRLWMRAIESYKKYLAMKPADPDARVDLGICYFEMGKMDSVHAGPMFALAIKEMAAVAKAHPKHQQAAFNLGIVHLNSGEFEESNKWFKKVVEINPGSELGKRAGSMLKQHSFPGMAPA